MDLNALVEALVDCDAKHRPRIPLREDMQHVPTGCSCGQQFEKGAEWDQANRHLHEARATAVVGALHRTCETCLGTGTWRKLRQDMICPDCDGVGSVVAPLPRWMYRDDFGAPWHVGISPADVRPNMIRAWVWRHDPEGDE